MMISPEHYIEMQKDASYPKLIRRRDELIEFIQEFEKNEIAGDRSNPDWMCHPQPNVQYQVYLEYLSGLCSLMKEKYNSDYVWGDRNLKDDFEKEKSTGACDL